MSLLHTQITKERLLKRTEGMDLIKDAANVMVEEALMRRAKHNSGSSEPLLIVFQFIFKPDSRRYKRGGLFLKKKDVKRRDFRYNLTRITPFVYIQPPFNLDLGDVYDQIQNRFEKEHVSWDEVILDDNNKLELLRNLGRVPESLFNTKFRQFDDYLREMFGCDPLYPRLF